VNEIHTNIESDSDSDFFDDFSNEESDDEDDLSARNRSWRGGHFTPRLFDFTAETGINSEILDSKNESPLDLF